MQEPSSDRTAEQEHVIAMAMVGATTAVLLHPDGRTPVMAPDFTGPAFVLPVHSAVQDPVLLEARADADHADRRTGGLGHRHLVVPDPVDLVRHTDRKRLQPRESTSALVGSWR